MLQNVHSNPISINYCRRTKEVNIGKTVFSRNDFIINIFIRSWLDCDLAREIHTSFCD